MTGEAIESRPLQKQIMKNVSPLLFWSLKYLRQIPTGIFSVSHQYNCPYSTCHVNIHTAWAFVAVSSTSSKQNLITVRVDTDTGLVLWNSKTEEKLFLFGC